MMIYRKMISMMAVAVASALHAFIEWFTKVKAKVSFDLFLLFLEWFSSSTLTIV